MLIDTHCHLDKLDLAPYDGDIAGALNAAYDNQVQQILTISVDLESFDQVYGFTSHAGVYASCGVHPLHTEGLLEAPDTLLRLAENQKVVAIGETGLDYFYEKDASVHERQKHSFGVHLKAAGDMELPVIVHTRDARDDTLSLIKSHGNSEVGGVLHCFTESYEMAAKALDENYLISISGIVTFKNAEELRDTIRKLPIEKLLVETDSPYLAPIPHRGKKNEPKYVRDVAQFVADLKGVRYEALLEITENTFREKFSKMDSSETLVRL